jgi:hypothetical protein
VSLRSEFRDFDVRYDFRMKTMFGSFLPPVVCMRAHVLFALFVFACVLWYPKHIELCNCFVFLRLLYPMSPVSLRLLYPMSPVSLDCTFWIALSVFPNICLLSFLVACFAWTVDEYRKHKSKISRIKPC